MGRFEGVDGMRIGLGAERAGTAYEKEIRTLLESLGHEAVAYARDAQRLPNDAPVARRIAMAVAQGRVVRGIVVGATGNSEAMAANRIRGVRCAVCWSREAASLARRLDDANMLALGVRSTSLEAALDIVRVWLEAPFEGGEHVERIRRMDPPGPPARGAPPSAPKPAPNRTARAAYDVLVSFRYILYSEGSRILDFQLDPGLKGPSIIHVPSPERWKQDMPAWAQGRREEILKRVRSKCSHLPYALSED